MKKPTPQVEVEAALMPVWAELRRLAHAVERLAALDMRNGGLVPGEPLVPGDDALLNDIVYARLSPGEIVLPRSVTSAPNAPERAAAFVQGVLSAAPRR